MSSKAASLPRRARPAGSDLPLISVVVPVRNEARFIAGTLAQLLEQAYPASRFEVIVADGRSTDETRSIVAGFAARHANVHLVDNPRCWSSAGRNAGIRASRGEIIVIVDGHCELDDDKYLQNLASAFTRSGADCVGRPQPLDVTGATPLQQAVAAARTSWLGHHTASWIYSSAEQIVPPQSVAVAYRREVFERIGLFDEAFDACEDVELNHRADRAGLKCLFTPTVRVRYVPRGSLPGLFRQLARYGRGRMRLLRKHGDTLSLASLLPALFVTGLLAGPVAAWLVPWAAAAYFGVLALYASLVIAVSLAIAVAKRRPGLFPWLPLVFAAIHAGSGTGVLIECLMAWLRGCSPAVDESTADASQELRWRNTHLWRQHP